MGIRCGTLCADTESTVKWPTWNQISWKAVQRFPSCYIRIYARADMSKLMDKLLQLSIAKAPEGTNMDRYWSRTQLCQCVPEVCSWTSWWIVGHAVPNKRPPTNIIQAVSLKDPDIWYRLQTPPASDECKQRRTCASQTRTILVTCHATGEWFILHASEHTECPRRQQPSWLRKTLPNGTSTKQASSERLRHRSIRNFTTSWNADCGRPTEFIH
jgi:hypothetical protein